MPIGKPKPLLLDILPPGVMERLSFVYSRGDFVEEKKFPLDYKMLGSLCSKVKSSNFYILVQVLFVDVDQRSLKRTPTCMCYIPGPFQGLFRIFQMMTVIYLTLLQTSFHSYILCTRFWNNTGLYGAVAKARAGALGN